MLTGHDIVLISSIDWEFNWQGHQEIATRLAAAGNRVLYIENMGVRAPRLHDARRVVQRFFHWAGSLPDGGVRQVSPGLYVCSPLILPPFGSAARRQVNRRVLFPLLLRAIEKLRFKPDVIWTFLPTDTATDLVRLFKKTQAVVVYYCIADFAELSPHTNAILSSEHMTIELSDVVFAQCQELAERCSFAGRKAHVFPFGVNISRFANEKLRSNGAAQSPTASTSPSSTNTFMSELPRPVIGYVGGIHKYVDTQMLAAMARARPEWSWVLVGPLQTSVRELKRIPNIYLAGPKVHRELPRYIRDFDVGIVPYKSNGYTATVVPTKINEYLAVGKPVVSTDLPEVIAFNNHHDIIITSPNHASQFIASIEKALSASTENDVITRRQTVAALHDWDGCFAQMTQLIERALQQKCQEVN
jgi:glycosyltransferase involved in cell wall biosynthesis